MRSLKEFAEKITLEKTLIYILIFSVLVVFGFIFYLFLMQFTKSIKITSPLGSEEWGIGDVHKITWKARGIDKVGIVLFKGLEPKWIAKNVYAGVGSYDWEIYAGQPYGDDYWIAVFEYPWRKGNEIAYSDNAFAIVFHELASCDFMSIQNEWPYVVSDLPNLRRVFVTEDAYTGNLGGLEGADKKCQEEAEIQGFKRVWHAFIGGDGDQETAIERMKKTPKKTDGVFIEAKPGAVLFRGATCHRLLGKDLNDFLAKFSDLSVINQEKLGGDFSQKFGEIWLGRIDEKSPKDCTPITLALQNPYKPLAEKYSFTTTCGQWAQEGMFIPGYPVPLGQPKPPFPTCYTRELKRTDAVAVGGLASGLTGGGENVNSFTPSQGKSCDTRQRLLCIEE